MIETTKDATFSNNHIFFLARSPYLIVFQIKIGEFSSIFEILLELTYVNYNQNNLQIT